MSGGAERRLIGVDFTSRPGRRKPIAVARGRLVDGGALRLDALQAIADAAGFDALLHEPGPWLGVFDLPFGLPAALVDELGWPTAWIDCIRHYASLSRADIRRAFSAYCSVRPPGAKFAHRGTDRPAGASPSMKWVNPPVAFMLHAGVPALVAAGVHLPGLREGDPSRIAIEGYPGWLARAIVGRRSYKSDKRAKQTPERLATRREIVAALEAGDHPLRLRLRADPADRDTLIADGSGDRLDALLCLVTAAWAAARPDHGLPADAHPLEGWIAGIVAVA